MFDVLSSEVNINQPLFIEASAGTGKTFAIEHLFIRRLLEPLMGRFLNVEEIACLTFTRACSEELRQRIYAIIANTIIAIRTQSPLPIYLQRLLEQHTSKVCLDRLVQAKARLDSACISTIHGFSARLLNEFNQGQEASFEASFIEEEALHALVHDILSFEADPLLAALVQALLQHKQPVSALLNTIVDSLWESDESRDAEDIIGALYQTIQTMNMSKDEVRDALHAASEGYCGIQNKDGVVKAEVQRSFEAFTGLFVSSQDGCNTAKSDDFPILATWVNSAFFNSLLYFLRSPFVPSQLFTTLKKGAEPSLFVEQQLMPLSPLLEPLSSLDLLRGLIAKRLQPAVRAQLKKKKLYTPQSLLLEAVDALTNPAFRSFAEAKIRAIFIDEFQDTDPVQWKLFSTLFDPAREPPIYLVGDPKQSMYRFRGADIYTYLDVRRSFQPQNILTLDSNYRSVPALTDSLNSLFAPKEQQSLFEMPKQHTFLEVTALRAQGKAENLADGKQALCIPIVRDTLGKKRSWPHPEAEEKMLAYISDEIIRSGLPLSSFAILSRDRNQSGRIVQFLKERHIPVAVHERKPLGQTEALKALVRLLRALEAPEKRTVGIELFACAPWNIAPEQLKKCVEEVSAYTEQAALLFELQALYVDQGLLVALQHYSQCMQPHVDQEFYKDFIHCIDLLSDEPGVSGSRAIPDALSFCTKLYTYPDEVRGARLCRSTTGVNESVSVLTMHKSKGLEFDVVFALGVASRGLNSSHDVEEQAEKMRLFYVATTRAKRRLYLPFFIEEDKGLPEEHKCSPLELVFYIRGFTTLEDIYTFAKGLSATVEDVCASEPLFYEERMVHTATRQAVVSVDKERLQLSSFSSLRRKQHAQQSYIHEKERKREFPSGATVGSLIHRLIAEIGKKRVALTPENVGVFVLGTPLAGHEEGVLQRMNALFSMPLIDGLVLSQIQPINLWFETPFFFYENRDKAFHGTIDLLIESEEGYYGIDFKTHQLSEYTQETLKEHIDTNGYREQAYLYSTAIKRLCTHRNKPLKGFVFIFIHGLQEGQGIYFIPEGAPV